MLVKADFIVKRSSKFRLQIITCYVINAKGRGLEVRVLPEACEQVASDFKTASWWFLILRFTPPLKALKVIRIWHDVKWIY